MWMPRARFSRQPGLQLFGERDLDCSIATFLIIVLSSSENPIPNDPRALAQRDPVVASTVTEQFLTNVDMD